MQYLAVYERTKRNTFLVVYERDTINKISRHLLEQYEK